MYIYDSYDDSWENETPQSPQDTSLQDLMDAIKDEADMTGSSFLDNNQLIRWINTEMAELYDLLVAAYSEYFVALEAQALIQPGGFTYLPRDFYKAIGIYLTDGAGSYTRIKKMGITELDRFVSSSWPDDQLRYRVIGSMIMFSSEPASGNYVRIFYVPQIRKLVKPEDRIHCNIPVGWEDFIVSGGTARALAKEESDNSYYVQRKAYIRQHIIEMAEMRDESHGDKVIDVYRRFSPDYGYMDEAED